MSSDIPRARDELLGLANEVKGPIGERIKVIVKTWMHRDDQLRRARTKRRHITALIRDQIKADAAISPSDNLDEIGRRHRVDGGRVSEILHGKWDHLGEDDATQEAAE